MRYCVVSGTWQVFDACHFLPLFYIWKGLGLDTVDRKIQALKAESVLTLHVAMY